MKDVKVTLVQTVGIPDDAEIHIAPSGAATGIRLADGRLIQFQVAFEMVEIRADGEETYHDLNYDELVALDIDTNGDLEKDVEEV